MATVVQGFRWALLDAQPGPARVDGGPHDSGRAPPCSGPGARPTFPPSSNENLRRGHPKAIEVEGLGKRYPAIGASIAGSTDAARLDRGYGPAAGRERPLARDDLGAYEDVVLRGRAGSGRSAFIGAKTGAGKDDPTEEPVADHGAHRGRGPRSRFSVGSLLEVGTGFPTPS
jgi:hypothetical protein